MQKASIFISIPLDKKNSIKKIIEDKLAKNPILFGKPLKGGLRNHLRLRIGSYRIIYRVNIETSTVLVVAIGHRRDIYKDYQF
jgi:mRNA-degrading endonuclease RelE of RelBE toxin-antitoxin system